MSDFTLYRPQRISQRSILRVTRQETALVEAPSTMAHAAVNTISSIYAHAQARVFQTGLITRELVLPQGPQPDGGYNAKADADLPDGGYNAKADADLWNIYRVRVAQVVEQSSGAVLSRLTRGLLNEPEPDVTLSDRLKALWEAGSI